MNEEPFSWTYLFCADTGHTDFFNTKKSYIESNGALLERKRKTALAKGWVKPDNDVIILQNGQPLTYF